LGKKIFVGTENAQHKLIENGASGESTRAGKKPKLAFLPKGKS